MESVSIQVPASLYASVYERYKEETTSTVTAWLAKLIYDGEAISEPQTLRGTFQYPRPRTGTITGRVWEIADEIRKQSGQADREAVIKACMQQGININTASTQFSYWRKANP